MKIFGHPWIKSPSFAAVKCQEEIASTPAGSILLFDDLAAQIAMVHYCQKEGISFAVRAGDVTTALLAHALGANYIVASADSAQRVQQLAQHYLFDTQILVEITDESSIELYADMGLDGVILPAALLG